ncbi:unnamed protein product, partial [Auanema sp. JU1783]
MSDALVLDQKNLPKSLSDSQVVAAHSQKSPEASGLGLYIEEMGASGAAPGDRAWVLLAHRQELPVLIEFALREETVPAEEIVEREKLITFTVPTLPWDSNNISIKLTCGNSEISVPFKYRKRCRSVTPCVSIENLTDFATNGDTLALVQPFSFLLPQLDSEGNTVLHLAARNNQSFALKVLLSAVPVPDKEEIVNIRNSRGLTALHCAIRSGDPDSVHYLIANKAHAHIADNHNNTAVHYLADAYNEAIFKEILEPATADDLRIEQLNDEGYTALHLSVRRLKLSLIEMLLEAGANPNSRDRNDRTPLHHAVLMNDPDVVQFLVDHGSDTNMESGEGETALSLARDNVSYALFGYLLDAGADPSIKNKKGEALTETDDSTIQNLIKGERMALPAKEMVTSSSPSDLTTVREPLFGKSCPKSIVEQLHAVKHSRVILQNPHPQTEQDQSERDDADESSTLSGIRENARQRAARLMEEVEQLMNEPSTSRASTSTSSRRAGTSAANKDDIAGLDYLTRLRLSKTLDVDGKWQDVTKELGCEHMIELI